MENDKENKPVRKKKGAKRKKQSWAAKHSLAILTAFIAFLVLAGAFVVFCLQGYRGEGAWVYIPHDASSASIKDSLQSSLGSTEGNRVYYLWKAIGGKESLAHGAYFVENGDKSLNTAKRLKRGIQTPVKIKFNSSRTIDDAAKKLTAGIECTPQAFVETATAILAEQGFTLEEYPAAFLPDTYEVYWSDSPEKIMKRLLDERNRFWNEERLKKAESLSLNPIEVATLASIVEGETAKADEKATVARLYLNRLKKGMKLQADPTVKFATGDPSLKRILAQHLKIESPYNTYLHAGLPPGPIRIPDKSTLDAVLNAPVNNYLYMCAKEDFSGYHNFTSDYSTHLANARRYQAELNKRGIR